MKIYINIVVIWLGCLAWLNAANQSSIPPIPTTNQAKFDVVKLSTASGWMGDGTNGTKYVQINEVWKPDARRKGENCIKITYSIGPTKWAGIYWLNKPDNWGDKPGDDFSRKGFKRVCFWAKGEKGGEVVEFKAGSVNDKQFKDSFEATCREGKVTLEKKWKHYEISLEGQNLSSVIGLFCWVANEPSNPNGLTFYLDEIQYE